MGIIGFLPCPVPPEMSRVFLNFDALSTDSTHE